MTSFRDRFAAPTDVANRRVFEHHSLTPFELSAETTERGRFYTSPSGLKLPSVTTVLGKSFDDSWLDEWKARVGAEEAERVSNRAKARGTTIHAILEDYINNKADFLRDVTPVNVQSFAKMREQIDQHIGRVYGVELALWSEGLRTAGRTDLFAEWDGVPSIIDWKTASKPKDACDILTYFLQSTCYGMMIEERYTGMKVPQIVIGISVDHEEPQFFVRRKKEFLEETLRVFITDRGRIGI